MVIEPIFLTSSKESERTNFFEDLSLRSNAKWIDLDRTKVGVRGEGAAHINLRLKPKALQKPGLHEGLITATPRGTKLAALDIPVVIVTPRRFDTASSRTQTWKGSLAPGGIHRTFVEVPPGATAMNIEMSIPKDAFGLVYLNLYDPEGRSHHSSQRRASSQDNTKARVVVSGESLMPGVWEIVPYATFRNQGPSAFEVQTRFVGLDVPEGVDYFVPDGGGLEASLTVTNRFERPIRGDIEAHAIGWTREEIYEVEGPKYDTEVVLPAGTRGAHLAFEISADDYNLFTDIAVNVIDSGGQVVAQSGFGGRFLDLSFSGAAGSYSVEILGGTADPDATPNWTIELRETQRLSAPVGLEVTGPEGASPTLYPGVQIPLDIATERSLPERPDGFDVMVELKLEDRLHPGPALSYRLPFTRQ